MPFSSKFWRVYVVSSCYWIANDLFVFIELLTIYLPLIYLSEVNNYNPKVITQLIHLSTIYDGSLSTRYQHVTDTLPNPRLWYELNNIVL